MKTEAETILSDPRFRQLVQERSRFAWVLSAVMLAIYFGFILLVAFGKDFLGTRIGDGVTTLGILIGLAVIISAFVLTGIYVIRANGRFDALTRNLMGDR
ncbi:MAG: hypothetical protein RLY86_2473 [Pseudomonadota bacterium]